MSATRGGGAVSRRARGVGQLEDMSATRGAVSMRVRGAGAVRGHVCNEGGG